MTRPQSVDSPEALAAELRSAHMRGQWQNEAGRRQDGTWTGDTWTPAARGRPWLWPGAALRAFLDRSAEVLPEAQTSRRSIMLDNPALPRGSIETIAMGVQMILPGEQAWAHRHSMSALRFVIQGDPALVTVVNGIAHRMETGDLVLTPGSHWHDHHNGSDRAGLWLDVLDGPVINAINQTVLQNYSAMRQPLRNSADEAGGYDGPMRFAWRETEVALARRGAPDPATGHVFDYRDPATGKHPMRTLGCRMRRLPAGFSGTPYRTRANAVFYAFRGSGTVVVDGERLDWSEGDCFAVPGWSVRRFEAPASGDAFLFETHDEPLLENLGLLQGGLMSALEEPADVPQAAAAAGRHPSERSNR